MPDQILGSTMPTDHCPCPCPPSARGGRLNSISSRLDFDTGSHSSRQPSSVACSLAHATKTAGFEAARGSSFNTYSVHEIGIPEAAECMNPQSQIVTPSEFPRERAPGIRGVSLRTTYTLLAGMVFWQGRCLLSYMIRDTWWLIANVLRSEYSLKVSSTTRVFHLRLYCART